MRALRAAGTAMMLTGFAGLILTAFWLASAPVAFLSLIILGVGALTFAGGMRS